MFNTNNFNKGFVDYEIHQIKMYCYRMPNLALPSEYMIDYWVMQNISIHDHVVWGYLTKQKGYDHV